jgi:trans-aconitate 2-methyltransferase
MSTVDWNAETYHRVSEPQLKWGLEVMAELPLHGDELVIDAGCGTGRLTAHLLERLPKGKVVALDVSDAMLEKARSELARFGDRVEVQHGDLGDLKLKLEADVVFSAATFHWIFDHAALFKGLAGLLKPGGKLHAQCGGFGNLQGFLTLAREVAETPPFAAFLSGFGYPTHFAKPEDELPLLAAAGFTDAKAWLKDAPTPFATAEDFRTFIGVVVLRHPVAMLPEGLKGKFLDEVTARAAPGYSLDYVRLELRATRSLK